MPRPDAYLALSGVTWGEGASVELAKLAHDDKVLDACPSWLEPEEWAERRSRIKVTVMWKPSDAASWALTDYGSSVLWLDRSGAVIEQAVPLGRAHPPNEGMTVHVWWMDARASSRDDPYQTLNIQ